MQLGIRFHDSQVLPFEDRIKNIKIQGFSCVHLALSKAIDKFSVCDGVLTPGFAMYLKRLFYQNELDIAVLGCYLNLANPDSVQLKKITETYLAHIRFASILGCGVVGTETGAPNVNYSFESDCYSEKALTTLIHNLRPVVSYAEKLGVIIAIEPVRSHIVYNAKRARQVLDEISSPNLQIIWDPVNLLDIKNYKQQREVIEEVTTLLGSDIAVIHMKDFIIQERRLVSVAAGLGELEYEPILRFVKSKKPFIHSTLEDTQPDNAKAAKDYIMNKWNIV